MLVSANAALIAEHGWQALMDGGARQAVEFILSGYLSMAAYIIFKACEYRLTHRLVDAPPTPAPGSAAARPEEDNPGE